MAATKGINDALLAAQKAFPKIGMDATGQAGSRKYKYASLPSVLDAVLATLHDNGMILLQRSTQEGETLLLETVVRHTSGEEIKSSVPLPRPVDWQQWGSALTYARRYSITALLGLAPEEDDDAASAQGFSAQHQARQTATAAPRDQPSDEHPMVAKKREEKAQAKTELSSLLSELSSSEERASTVLALVVNNAPDPKDWPRREDDTIDKDKLTGPQMRLLASWFVAQQAVTAEKEPVK